MTARDEILAALPSVRPSDGTFTVQAVVNELQRRQSRYAESTIRTHVSSKMCVNAPDNHATTYNDLIRVAPGTYQAIE